DVLPYYDRVGTISARYQYACYRLAQNRHIAASPTTGFPSPPPSSPPWAGARATGSNLKSSTESWSRPVWPIPSSSTRRILRSPIRQNNSRVFFGRSRKRPRINQLQNPKNPPPL